MALWNRRKPSNDLGEIMARNAVNVNDLSVDAYYRPFCWDWKNKKGRFNFGRFFLQLVINRIYNGLENVTWQTGEITYLGSDIANFIDRNEQLLMWSYWKDGYAVLIVDKTGEIRLPRQNELRFDANGYITNPNAIVVYSNPYVTERTSHFKLIMPIMKNIDSNLNNQNFATENLGALGILSSKAVPMSPAGKAELNEKLAKDYGLSEDQFRFILTNQEMAYTPIELPLKDLEFSENVKNDINWLCNFFGISPDMVFGQSTYNNAAEATKAFYRTCIQPVAEVLLKLARTAFVFCDTELKPSTVITYRITNVPELNTSLSTECAEKTAYLELLRKLEEAGIDVSEDVARLYDSTRQMLENV